MTNPHRGGPVEFQAAGATYQLRYSIDAICRLEAATGLTFPAIAVQLGQASKVSVSLMRHVLHAGLFDHHPELDLRAAGELIATAGGIAPLMKKVDQAIALAFPSEASGTPNPPKANRAARRRAGTG